jgi:hypothetical protein
MTRKPRYVSVLPATHHGFAATLHSWRVEGDIASGYLMDCNDPTHQVVDSLLKRVSDDDETVISVNGEYWEIYLGATGVIESAFKVERPIWLDYGSARFEAGQAALG